MKTTTQEKPEVVEVPDSPEYQAMMVAYKDRRVVQIKYQGANDPEPRDRQAVILAEVDSPTGATCFTVFTQIEPSEAQLKAGRPAFGIRHFRADRILAVQDVRPMNERELAAYKQKYACARWIFNGQ